MKLKLVAVSLGLLSTTACITAEGAFVAGKLPALCDDAYYICNVTAGCLLDSDHYIEGVFPGTRRVVVETTEANAEMRVRMLLRQTEAPGTELLMQMYEPDCTLDTILARAHLEDVDLFEEAGDDRTLIFDLQVYNIGEHLFEVFSDASTEYDLIIEPKPDEG